MDETEKSLSTTMLAPDNQDMVQKKKKNRGDKDKKKKRKRSNIELAPDEQKDGNLEAIIGTNKKRKLKDEKSSSTSPTVTPRNTKPISTKKVTNKYLNGMVVAISTLDVQGQAHANAETSYKAVMSKCLEVGAQVTGQVHKRVHLLLSSRTTIQKQRLLTQRLRKALKKKIPIVDLEWLHECQKVQQRIDYAPYELTSLAFQTQQEQLQIANEKDDTSRKPVDSKDRQEDDEIDEYAGWSEPQELGCCCVCHENGDDDCKWCVDCSINRLKRLKSPNAEEPKQKKVEKKVKKKSRKKERSIKRKRNHPSDKMK